MTVLAPYRDRFVFTSKDELADSVSYWKDILRLQPWDIRVSIKRAFDMTPDCVGTCRAVKENQTAFIGLLDPIDYDPSSSFPIDHEKTLVHELLHLHFEAIFPDGNSPLYFMVEQVIDALSKALVRVRRENSPQAV